jgi:hypothetical protein
MEALFRFRSGEVEAWEAERKRVQKQILDGIASARQLLDARVGTGVEAARGRVDQLRGVMDKLSADVQTFANSLEEVASAGGFTFKFLSWNYLSRLFFAIAVLYLGMYMNAVASAIAGYRTPWIHILDLEGRVTGSVTLPDLGHDLLPYLDWFRLPDHFIEANLAMFLVLIAIHPKRFLIIRRGTMILALIYILRSYTVLVTSLPDASPACQAQFHDPMTGAYKREPMFPKVFRRGLKVLHGGGKQITCGDMIFSGHASVLMVTALVFQQYCRKEMFKGDGRKMEFLCALGRWITALFSFSGIIAIIATRLHYTLDVSIAIYLNYRVWKDYHTMVRVVWLKKQNWIFQWLEAEEIINLEMKMHQAMKPVKWE